MSADYVALYRSLIRQPFMSEREMVVPLPRLASYKKANGDGHGNLVEGMIRWRAAE